MKKTAALISIVSFIVFTTACTQKEMTSQFVVGEQYVFEI